MRILFFMFTAARTGSEVALHNFIWHAAGRGWEMGVACEVEGELLRRMPPGVPTFTYGHGTRGAARAVYEGVRRRMVRGEDLQSVAAIHRKFRPDAWYINTCLQPRIVGQAKRNRIPFVLHTHEMEQVLGRVTEADARAMAEAPSLVVAGSEAARDVFRTLGRRAAVEVCYENIDPRKIAWSDERSREIRRSLKIGDGTFVWAMSGTLDPNKNPTRFAELAAEMLRAGLDVHFIWLGAGGSGYSLYAERRAEELGVAGKVSWLGERDADYYDHFNAADGLVLTSFTESFSLVSVEAAYLGKPVVAFNCGGVREIIREGMGVVVDSWNNSDLIAKMVSVMRGEIGFDASAARERVKEFDVGVQGPRWERVVSDHLMPPGGSLYGI